jgi:hypothetical protein
MVVTRHTRGAPAGIQRQYQRDFIPAMDMQEGDGSPTLTTAGISPVWQMDTNKRSSVNADWGVPLDIIAGRDLWAYPIFNMSINIFANIRFGIYYLPMVKETTTGGTYIVIENTIAADGTGTIIPRRPEWLTIEGWRVARKEDWFQMDDFAGRIVNMQLEIYRDGESVLDEHGGSLYLQGLAIMYEAFI